MNIEEVLDKYGDYLEAVIHIFDNDCKQSKGDTDDTS